MAPRFPAAVLVPALMACVCRFSVEQLSTSGSASGGSTSGGSTTGFQGESCAGTVTVTQGLLGGGGSQGFAGSGFYAFGPRLFLTSGS
jgi:hypothetical protein